MKMTCSMLSLIGLIAAFNAWTPPAHASMGDYISAGQGDSAFFVSIKSSYVDYDSPDVEAGDIDRKILTLGFSRALTPRLKGFGGLGYTFDGELGETDADLDEGYCISAGASYVFWDQAAFALQASAQLNYLLEESFSDSSGDMALEFNGYELITGLKGNIKITPRFYIYSGFRIVPISDYSMKISSNALHDTWSLSREQSLGLIAGAIYDLFSWYLKGDVEIGSERSFSLLAGKKF